MIPRRKYLVCSFSGGRTSALMTLLVRAFYEPFYEKTLYLFANTGEEHPETLAFVDRFARHFKIPLIWLEAVTSMERGKGTSFKIVNYETASRIGQVGPFDSISRKYGVANMSRPLCSKELKRHPILAYTRSLGMKRRDVAMAIGIRVDEIDRMSDKADEQGIVYPMVKFKLRKQDVLDFWRRDYPNIDLHLPEHFGNCVGCWKKSDRKLFTVAREFPQAFETFIRIGDTCKMIGAEKVKGSDGMGHRFYRGERTARDIIMQAVNFENVFVDSHYLDLSNGCSDSCEVDFE